MTAIAKVAVIDDNPATLYATSRVLRAADFEVLEGKNGEQALEFAFHGIDILLLDVNLPDIHGFEVCRRLRSDPRTARLPVIHISSTFVKEIDKARGLNAGSDGYLTHPVEPPVLIATVRAFLRARRAEEELRRSETKFKAIFENAPGGLILFDNDLVFREVNPPICRFLGHPPDDIIGQPLTSFMVVPADFAAIDQALRTRGTWQGIVPLLRQDGESIHSEWRFSANDVPGVRLAVVTDITERIRLEKERDALLDSERIARAEAERANRLKDEFLGTLSHELRTPLNSILLWTQLLQQRETDAEQFMRGLASIERNTRLQSQLIADLLDVSQIISGKLRLQIEPVDLGALIKSALDGLKPAIEAKQLTLKTTVEKKTIGVISGDRARLEQVIWNLVNNAIKFTPSQGEIEVALERTGQQVELSVIDNGQGITPELLPHLFERFCQGEGNANRKGGLGLGLAIVKHLVELHGGTVNAASPGPGQGARFTVQVPISAQLKESIFPPVDFSHAGGPRDAVLEGVRVMIVEDDEDAVSVMSYILEESGAAVSAAANVDAALAKISTFRPQILVSDIRMPGRDGYDLIREVRALGLSFHQLPAIALTALAHPEDRRRALLAGYQVHVPKPIDAHELTTTIAALLGRTGLPLVTHGDS